MALEFEREIVELEDRIGELTRLSVGETAGRFEPQIRNLRKQLEKLKVRVYSRLSPWETVQVARHGERPVLRDYVAGLFSEFIELHGDRCFGDDRAVMGGFATVGNQRVMLIGHQKGKGVQENVKVNFGMAHPEGYRKALRLMRLAEKYRLPILSFIDTPGAYPGAGAEARGQAEAIARNLTEMSTIGVPIVVVVTGEGGSGGAIGIGVGDVVIMLSNAVYSVISPEGCASILWRDGTKAADAASALKLTAKWLLKLGVIDEIVGEPVGGAHRDHAGTIAAVREAVLKHLGRLKRVPTAKLLQNRFEKYAAMGKAAKTRTKRRKTLKKRRCGAA